MKVFIWGPGAEGAQWLSVAKADMRRLVAGFRGLPMGREWSPLVCQVESLSESGERLAATDFPSLHYAGQAISSTVAHCAGDYLRLFSELLPLDCPQGEYFAVNVTHTVDALDPESSDIVFFPDGRRFIRIDKYVFLPKRLADAGIFKLPQQLRGPVLLTEQAADVLAASGADLDLRLVWEEDV